VHKGSSEALDDSQDDPMSPERQSQLQHRANTVMHVCWHRSTSVGVKDHNIAVRVSVRLLCNCCVYK